MTSMGAFRDIKPTMVYAMVMFMGHIMGGPMFHGHTRWCVHAPPVVRVMDH